MKKTVSLLLIAIMILTAFSLPVYAVDPALASDEKSESATWEHSLAYSCIYDAESKRVRVSGTIDSEVFADYSDWTLCVYSIPAGKTEHDVISDPDAKPLAEAMASIKFDFNFKTERISDRFSKYALFLRSPKNEFVLTASSQYPEVRSSFEYPSGNHGFKGFSGDFSSFCTEINAGTAILPIDVSALVSKTSTSMFVFVDHKQYFFNEAAVEALDVAIRSMSVSGTRVYLRLLYPADNSAPYAQYLLPDLYSDSDMSELYSVISFVSDRYGNNASGKLGGFILGKGWDEPEKYNYFKTDSFDEYVNRCVLYTTVVANTARVIDPSLDIVVPLTAIGFNKSQNADVNATKKFAEAFLKKIDTHFYAGIEISFLIDSATTPLGITNYSVSNGNSISLENPNSLFYAGAEEEFSKYLLSLSSDYRSTPDKYMFVWTPDTLLRANALTAAYSYAYYALLQDSSVYVFALEAPAGGTNGNLRDVAHIMKNIDTYEGVRVTERLPKLFGKDSWDDIFGVRGITNSGTKHCYTVEAKVNDDKAFSGEFSYFDFSQASIVEGWHCGAGCSEPKLNLSEDMQKALGADLALNGIYGAGEMLYVPEYAENMIYTPTLRFSLSVTQEKNKNVSKNEGDNENTPSLFEIKITLGNRENSIESSCIVSSDTVSDVYMDISQYIAANVVEYIRISVRSMDGTAEKCRLSLYGISGLSSSYSSEQLNTLISSERDKIRHSAEQEEDRQHSMQIAVALGIVLIIGVIGVLLFIGVKRDDNTERNRKNSTDKN